MKILLLFGEPGTGKSSVLNMLLDEYQDSIAAFSIKKYADFIINSNDSLTLAQQIMNERERKGLLSGEIINALVDHFIETNKMNRNWLVFENYPLSLKQSSHLLSLINQEGVIVEVIHLYADRLLLEKRIKERMICEKCDETQRIEASYQNVGKCPKCGAPLRRRGFYAHDTMERIINYEKKLREVIKYIDFKTNEIDVNNLSMSDTYKKIKCIMELDYD